MTIPSVLTIAGSDSGGGAGIEADLKTFARLKVHGLCAITAITSQNTHSVKDIFYLPAEVVISQIETVARDIEISAVKTGMLGRGTLITQVCKVIKNLKLPNLVVDPVIESKSKTLLMNEEGKSLIKTKLIPLATVVTPNIEEAELLSGLKINSVEKMKEAAKTVNNLGAQWVVITGGHLEEKATDILYNGSQFWEYAEKKIHSTGVHGTGCTFSSAIAAYLAKGLEVPDAVLNAKEFISKTIQNALEVGKGYPLANQFYDL